MAPAKKRRTTNSSKAGKAISDVKDVPSALIVLKDWVREVYDLRHGSEEAKAWPVLSGGSYLDIVQRAWNDSGRLIEDSAKFLRDINLIPAGGTETYLREKWCSWKAIPQAHTWQRVRAT